MTEPFSPDVIPNSQPEEEEEELPQLRLPRMRDRNIFDALSNIQDAIEIGRPDKFELENSENTKMTAQLSRFSFGRNCFSPDAFFFEEADKIVQSKLARNANPTERKKLGTFAKRKFAADFRPAIKRKFLASNVLSSRVMARDLFKGHVDTTADTRADQVYRLKIVSHMIKARRDQNTGTNFWRTVKEQYHVYSRKTAAEQRTFYESFI